MRADVISLQDFRTRADVFPVGGIQEKFIEMTAKYNEGVLVQSLLRESASCIMN